MLYILFAVFAGICVTTQNSINGLMSPYLGAMGVSLVGFTVQTALLVLWQLIRSRRVVSLKKVPRVYFLSGLMATITVGTIGLCVARMGSAVTTCCSIAGQVILSAVVDHFGLFGTKRNPFAIKRLPGFLLILGGILLINLSGSDATGDAPLWMLLYSILLGCGAIVIRKLNHLATEAAGSAMAGSMVNSLGGLVCALILYIFMSGFKPDFAAFGSVPPVLFTAGLFGIGSLVFNIYAYRKLNIFYATVFMLFGQIVTGIVMDLTIFHTLSAGKCAGVAVVAAGVLLDKLLTKS